MKWRISKPVLFFACAGLLFFAGLSPCQADGLKIEKIPSNRGYIETASVSYGHHRLYVKGWVRPHAWGGGRVSVKVDLKDAGGNVIATQTTSSLATGRPQLLMMFGVSYGVSFDDGQAKDATSIDVGFAN